MGLSFRIWVLPTVGHCGVRLNQFGGGFTNWEPFTIWIADAHRGDGKRFVVRADEKLTAFLELEGAVRTCSRA